MGDWSGVERSLQVVIYREGDGFVAQCLNVDIASDGASEAEARANIREALELYFDEPDTLADYQPGPDGRIVIVPMDRQHLKIGTFRSICRQAGLQPTDF